MLKCKLNKKFFENHDAPHYLDYKDSVFTILITREKDYLIYLDTFILPVMKDEINLLQ